MHINIFFQMQKKICSHLLDTISTFQQCSKNIAWNKSFIWLIVSERVQLWITIMHYKIHWHISIHLHCRNASGASNLANTIYFKRMSNNIWYCICRLSNYILVVLLAIIFG